MSSFYEVTAASGTGGGGRRVHEKAPVWAGCRVSHPAADRTLTRGVGPRRGRLPYSPYGLAIKATGLTRTHRAQQPQRRYTAVAVGRPLDALKRPCRGRLARRVELPARAPGRHR